MDQHPENFKHFTLLTFYVQPLIPVQLLTVKAPAWDSVIPFGCEELHLTQNGCPTWPTTVKPFPATFHMASNIAICSSRFDMSHLPETYDYTETL
jgi:hypothetical protein